MEPRMTDEQTAKRWKEFKFKREEIKADRERGAIRE